MQEDYQQLIDALGGAEATGPFIADFLKKETKRRVFPLTRILQKEGTVPDTVYFIIRGIIRLYYGHAGGRQRKYKQTSAFFSEGDFACTLYSFLRQKPANQSIELLSPATVLTLSYESIQKARAQFLEAQLLLDKIKDDYFEQLKERSFLLGCPVVKDRYRLLAERKSWLFDNIPTEYVATYIGTTRETLSRARSRYR